MRVGAVAVAAAWAVALAVRGRSGGKSYSPERRAAGAMLDQAAGAVLDQAATPIGPRPEGVDHLKAVLDQAIRGAEIS